MENAYLLELIRTLGAEEQEELPGFVDSPYFNRGKHAAILPALLRIILEMTTKPDGTAPDKRGVYHLLFPGQDFVEGKLDKVMAELNKLVRTFLLVRRYLGPDNTFQQSLDLAGILRERGLTARYKQSLSKLEKYQENVAHRTAQYFYDQFLLELEIHEWQNTFNQSRGDVHIPVVVRNLDVFFLIYRLELLNRFLLQQKVAKVEMPCGLDWPFQESEFPDHYLNESVVLLITYKIYHLLRRNELSVAAFQELIDLLTAHEREIGPTLLRQFYTYARNFCVLLLNSGSHELATVLHHLQKDNLARGYLYYEGKLSPSTYISVATVAIRVRNPDWALQFVEAHREKVIGDNETLDFYRLNRANCLFALGRYAEALDVMPNTSPYVEYLLIIRRLELKILYETRSELLPYRIDAFKMFLSRASRKFLIRSRREYHNNFVNLLQQLTHSTPNDAPRAERLIRRITSRKSVADRDWLLEKARQLV